MSTTEPRTLSQGLAVPPFTEGDAAAVYEETHVHGVYEAIAPHFSATRHKPWPLVSSFLASQPPGSVGFDVGCGNGKNVGVNQDVVMLACDRSAALVALARDTWCTRFVVDGQTPDFDRRKVIAGADVAVADSLQLPFREASADFVICIAVIHHLSTRQRRVEAIRQLLCCIRRNPANSRSSSDANSPSDTEHLAGRVLVYVWALEQSSSRRGWDEGSEQDLLVPWVMKAPQQKKPKAPQPPTSRKKKQDLSAGCQEHATTCGDRNGAAKRRDASSGEGGEHMQGHQQQSRGNHGDGGGAAAATGAGAGAGADAAAPPSEKQSTGGDKAEGTGGGTGSGGQQQLHGKDQTFHRFYHLYKMGELEQDVTAAGGQVLRSGYERDNWWVIAC